MTDQERKVMEMALEALEFAASEIYNEHNDDVIADAIEALRTALAQPEHYSDCAVHNEPAYPKGECDCKTKSPEIIPTVPDNMQDWAKLDGATAWLLMERHANNWSDIEKMMDEFVAAKVALAQPEQEPVAWEKSYDIACALLRQAHDILATTQYPIKRPWVSLTAEEISESAERMEAVDPEDSFWRDYARAIEAKLKEKNNG